MKKKHNTPLAPTGIRSPLRTLIVDDSELLLSVVSRFLDTQVLVQVVGMAANGSEALQKAAVLTPDLVLMDLNMPCMSGLETTALLRCRLPGARIIIMTLDETVQAKAAAYAHGAHGFVGKTQMIRTLMDEIQRVFLLNDSDEEKGTV